MSKEYLSRFRKGASSMGMSAIDFYRDGENIIKHEWAMGGETKASVAKVPESIDGYRKIDHKTKVNV